MSDRRTVRTTPDFFAQLDLQLRDERGPRGEPSSVDFLGYEMVAIVETFATGWEDLPALIPGRSDYRLLVKAGYLVRAFSVVGQLAPDGALDLVQIDIDTSQPES